MTAPFPRDQLSEKALAKRVVPHMTAGQKLRKALRECGQWNLEIIKRSDIAKGFEVLPRRWVVERIFGWFGRCRRLAKDWEKSIASATACINIASIRVMTRTPRPILFPFMNF